MMAGTPRAEGRGMNAPREHVERSLRASHLFQGVQSETCTTLAISAVARRYKRGEYVWHEGEDATWMAVIASGLVKIIRRGSGTIVALLGPHETFGELAIVGGGPYSADAVAATKNVELLCLDAEAVRSTIEGQPTFARAIERTLVAHGRSLEDKIQIMSAGCVEKRLAALLRHLFDRFGDDLEDGSSIVPVNLSRAELASLVGATIETTIRTMSRWHKEHLVSTQPEGFVLHDFSRIIDMAGGVAA
jgi:CRP/FNR family transcriptional regulator